VASKKLDLTIRATNGTPWETDRFGPNQRVGHVRDVAVRHFVTEQVMAAGDYLLARTTDGQAQELADSAQLDEAGVVDGDVLVLLVRGPQVDG
jgi:hypothetical protein